MKAGDVVYLEWRDSTSIYGWMSTERAMELLSEGTLVCKATGFFVGETDKAIGLISQAHDDALADLLIVPKESLVAKPRVLSQGG
jgi:hypothetical protein